MKAMSVFTRIMPVNNTNLFMMMVNIDPRDDKSQPVADVVFFTNKTSLAEHYRLLGKVLNDIRKNDNTIWVWNKVRVELNDLARKVERDLGEYNVEGVGFSAALDDGYWDCVVQCLIQDCLPEIGGICNLCLTPPGGPCYLALRSPNYLTAGACALCLGISLGACMLQCA